jgi:hypothetical protein
VRASLNVACTTVSSTLRNRDRSLFVRGAGPRVFVPSSRKCLAISRPTSALPIFACVHCLPVGDTTRASFLRHREARGISEVTHTSAAEMCSTIQVVGCVCAIADQDHSHIRCTWRPDWSRPVGDDENIEPKARRHAIDLLPHRARITIDVDVSQLPACFRLRPQIWFIRTGCHAMADHNEWRLPEFRPPASVFPLP